MRYFSAIWIFILIKGFPAERGAPPIRITELKSKNIMMPSHIENTLINTCLV